MSESNMNENRFGTNLQHLRKAYGETLKEVGELLNLSGTALKNYESGERAPHFEIIQQIAMHYGITVDELLNSDLSGIGKIDISIQGMNKFVSVWKTMIPLFKSDMAMTNPDFQKGYNKCQMIIDRYCQNIPVSGSVIGECSDYFLKAAEKEIPEAIANLLWLIFLNWFGITDQKMNDLFTSIIYPRKNQESITKKMMKARECVSEEVQKKRMDFLREIEADFITLLKILKSDMEWDELCDYYVGLKYLFGMEDNGYSQEMNKVIGMEILKTLGKVGNRYAINVLKIMQSI